MLMTRLGYKMIEYFVNIYFCGVIRYYHHVSLSVWPQLVVVVASAVSVVDGVRLQLVKDAMTMILMMTMP